MLIFPFHFLPLAGATAGTSGLFAIFARLESESDVRWSFILPVRAGTLLFAYMAVDLFFTIVPSPEYFWAAPACLGGSLAGLAIVRLGWHRDFVPLPWESWAESWRTRKTAPRRRELVRATPAKGGYWRKDDVVEDTAQLPAGEFISREVDPILDKISAHGIQSLTERERKILEAARAKMAKR
jgi:hypothetical protein